MDMLNAAEAREIALLTGVLNMIETNALHGNRECRYMDLADEAAKKLTDLGYELEKNENISDGMAG